jgi:hypothetical protein
MFKFGRLIGVSRGLKSGSMFGRGRYGNRSLTESINTIRGVTNRLRGDAAFSSGLEEAFEDYFFNSTFDLSEQYWEEFYTDILDSTTYLADERRTGQKVVIEEYMIPAGKDYCEEKKEDFDPDEFEAHIRLEIGDDKYNAVDEIVPEIAKDLYAAADEIFGIGNYAPSFAAGYALGGGIRGRGAISFKINRASSIRRFQDYIKGSARIGSISSSALTPNRVFSSNKAALANWQAGGITRFASATGRSYGEAAKLYGGKEYRQFNLQTNIKKLNARGVYLPSQLSGKERSASLAAIQQTRNQVTYFGKRW